MVAEPARVGVALAEAQEQVPDVSGSVVEIVVWCAAVLLALALGCLSGCGAGHRRGIGHNRRGGGRHGGARSARPGPLNTIDVATPDQRSVVQGAGMNDGWLNTGRDSER